jgi:hypothetical protein
MDPQESMKPPHNDAAEERRLARRIRLDVLVALASFFLQSSVLGYALFTDGSTRVWVLWVALLAFSGSVATFSLVRASRLSRRYRFLKWGEK